MPIDLTQFYQVFFEEAGEHLGNMESLLLGLDLANPDSEQLNAIFRAAHSIKGSAGTFGFADMAEVTHVLENLLDRIRRGELALRNEMVDAFLDAGDLLKTLLLAHRSDEVADPAAVEAICRRLGALTQDSQPVDARQTGDGTASDAAQSADDGCDVYFVLDAEGQAADGVVAGLLAELSELADARLGATPECSAHPYRIELRGTVDTDAVRGILNFVARSDTIRIVPRGDAPLLADVDGADGFFSDATEISPAAMPTGVPAPVAEAAYGFFDGAPGEPPGIAGEPAAALDGEDGYGFFADLPDPAAETSPPSRPPSEPAARPTADSAPEPAETTTRRDDAPPPSPPPTANASAPPLVAAKGGGDTTIRVGIEKVDQLINLVGELVITQAMLQQSANGVDPVLFERLHSGLAQLERNSRDLQEAVMSIRMMPISVVFSRFPRVVREVSQKLGKRVELKMVGEGTELDKSLIERIADPLTHLIRNSLDHGIEMPNVRVERGKRPLGTITLRAYHQSGNIVIEVGDDGAGLDRQKILVKARARGLPVHDQMSDQEVWQLIFEAGFSTADVVTEVSGRGVGMDVVKRNIHAMGGRVEIESMPGVGTRMTVRLPLTLAILDGMSVAVGEETYIVPLGYVVESLQADPETVKSMSGVRRLLHVRGEYLPIIALHEVFGVAGALTGLEAGIMVIIEADGSKVALFVDALVGQQQVVIKSLEANYRRVAGVSGATIMGDGHVALILDVAVLAAMGRSALAMAA